MGNTEGSQQKDKPEGFVEFNPEEFNCKIELFYKDYIEKTTSYYPKQSYKEYKQLAPEQISPINAQCLNVQLQFSSYLVDNLSIFLFNNFFWLNRKIIKKEDKTIGFNLADQALKTAISNIKFFEKNTYVEPAQIMQELRDYIQYWEKKYKLKSMDSEELQ